MSDQHRSAQKILVPALLCAAACGCSRAPESTGLLLFGRMKQLAQAPTLTLDLVRDALEVDFTKEGAASHITVT